MGFFFCRVQFHRELLKKKKRIFLYSLVLGFNQNGKLSSFPSSPFHSTYTLNQNQGHLVIYSVRVWRERSCFNYIKFYKLCIKKKTNYYIFYCSLSEFYIKYMFIPNSIHHLTDQIPKPILHSPKYTSKPTSTCGLDSLF